MKKVFVFFVFTIIASINIFAQTGAVKGTVTADEGGVAAPAPFANVILQGTTTGATTDFDGNFTFNAPVGKHNLVISYIGFNTDTIEIDVSEAAPVVVNRTLKSGAISLKSFVVEATQDRTNENYQLMEQKKATAIQQSIGVKELSAKGVSDVAEGLTKVSGISKSNSGSGSVFVRGMGDRYNNALLNGLPVPSPNPDQKVIPLNIFPTSVVSNIGISKTFTPNIYGDFAGGTIDIQTKNYPDEATFEIGIGTSINTITTFQPFYNTKNSGLEKLGYYKSSRSLPQDIDKEKIYTTDQLSPSNPFTTNLTPNKTTAMPSYSLSLNGGNAKKLRNGMLVGFLIASNHGNSLNTTEGFNKNFDNFGAEMNDYAFTRNSYSTRTSSLENIYLEINENHSVSLTSLYVHDSENEFSMFDSQMEDRDRQGYLYNLRNTVVENTLLTNQLGSTHKLFNNKINFDWRGSYSTASNDVPDRTQFLSLADTPENIDFSPEGLNASDNHRFFSSLNENETSAMANLTYNFKTDSSDVSKVLGKISIGGQTKSKTRSFIWRQLNIDISRLNEQQDIDDSFIDPLAPGDYINSENIETKLIRYKEQVDPSREHSIEQNINSAYAILSYDLIPEKFNVTAGGRMEQSTQFIRYKKLGDLFNGKPRTANLDTTVILPSLSIKYSLSEKSNIRAAASQTISRPSMKELSPFQFQEQSGVLNEGNPLLYNGVNYNADLKYEVFPNLGELIAVSAFYKKLDNPIERAQIPSSGILYSYFNMGEATVMGLELEVSKKLSNIVNNEASALNNVSIGFNASYLKSTIKLGDGIINTNKGTILATNNERAMYGASPFLINADVAYNFTFKEKVESKWTMTYNIYGKRIFAAGTMGRGDIYEQPVGTLDLVVKNTINEKLKFNFSVKNILNPSVMLTQEILDETYELNSYKRGQTISLGLTYSIL